MTLKDRQIAFVKTFDSIETWVEKFNYLIEIGTSLPVMGDHLKKTSTLIGICQSRTYFFANITHEKVHIEGWSSSSIISGLIGMVKEIFEGVDIQDLSDCVHLSDYGIYFHERLEFDQNMTPQRFATLEIMIQRIIQLC